MCLIIEDNYAAAHDSVTSLSLRLSHIYTLLAFIDIDIIPDGSESLEFYLF